MVPGKPRVEVLLKVSPKWTQCTLHGCFHSSTGAAWQPVCLAFTWLASLVIAETPQGLKLHNTTLADAYVMLLCPQVLEAQGQAAVSPADRHGLHPLLIPLAQQQGGEGGSSGSAELTCLLRWPEGHKGMELPVVSQARGGTQVRTCNLAEATH